MKKRYWIPFTTLAIQEIQRFTRIWPQTLLPPIITTTLYFLIFGHLIGSRIGKMSGFDYMSYITPGLIMMAAITSAYANVSSSFFSAKFQRSFEEWMVAPVSSGTILCGYLSGGILRSLLIAILVSIVALSFSGVRILHPFLAVITILLTALLFSLAGFLNGLYAKKFDDVSVIPTFVLTPLTYLGGVFYSISQLPLIWQKISLANPILYMVNAFRYAFLGHSDINIVFAMSMLVFLVILLGALAWYLLEKGAGLRE